MGFRKRSDEACDEYDAVCSQSVRVDFFLTFLLKDCVACHWILEGSCASVGWVGAFFYIPFQTLNIRIGARRFAYIFCIVSNKKQTSGVMSGRGLLLLFVDHAFLPFFWVFFPLFCREIGIVFFSIVVFVSNTCTFFSCCVGTTICLLNVLLLHVLHVFDSEGIFSPRQEEVSAAFYEVILESFLV